MNKVIRFDRARRAPYRPARRKLPIIEFALAATAVGALAYVAIDQGIVSLPLTDPASVATPSRGDLVNRRFAQCAGAGGTCVIDGDTIRIDGVSIRVADIDTPEVRNYNCSYELELGRHATQRMIELLNQGAFTLAPYERDEDVYGRKLRILERNGQSLGMILVAEGLARPWDGARRSWCG